MAGGLAATALAGALASLCLCSAGALASEPALSIESESASNVTSTDATLQAQIDTNGRYTAYEFQIDTNSNYDYTQMACPLAVPGYMQCMAIIVGAPLPEGLVEPPQQDIPAGSSDPQAVSLDLASIGATLQPGTTYHYRVIASNGGQGAQGPDQTFTTPGGQRPPQDAPSISSLEPANGPSAGGTRVLIHGDLLENARAVYFGSVPGKIVEEECGGFCEIVPYTTLLVESPPHAAGTVDVTVETSQGLSAIQPGDQFTYGSPPAAPSEVLTEPAEATSDGFKLKGKLNPENTPTTYYFVYKDTGVECENMLGCGPMTAVGGPLSGDTQQEVPPIEVTGLTPGMTYRYWIVASNANGAVRGPELTFTTAAPHARPLGDEKTPTGGNLGQVDVTVGAPFGSNQTPSLTPATITPPVSGFLKTVKPTVLTKTQKLAEALKQCKKDKSKRKQTACRKQAKKKYALHSLATSVKRR